MTVKRHEGPVLAAAQAIRGGRWPLLPSDVKEPIAFLPCDTGEQSLATTAVDLYAADPDDTQILVAKRHGAGGAETINRLAQQRFASMRPAVMTMGQEFTGFHVGDKLLCTRNLWDRGLQNGSMGVITRLEQTPVEQFDDRGRTTGWTLAWVEWDDGLFRPLVEEMLDDLTLGYAVTVHKAQGSQWKRIIVPIVPTRLLDRALLYTAVTRAQSQVILLGDDVAAELAVESLPRAETRSVALDLTARQMIDACRSNGLPGTGDDCRS
jgi:exodeoxyribonuclease V alpha subunit